VRAADVVRNGEWLAFARRFLEELPGERGRFYREEAPGSAGIEAQALLSHVMGQPRAWVLAHPEVTLTPQQLRQITQLLARLARGEPLPYLTGRQEFYGLEFEVTPAVLIPRPETELLVEQAIGWLRQTTHRHHAADVGTGSGCIAVTLAKQLPDLEVLAVDRSPEALAVARRNAARHGVERQITFQEGDLLSSQKGPFDLVCANLPYIPSETLTGLLVAKYEPKPALDGGSDGLEVIRALVADAPRWLAPGGLLLLEMQYDQGEAISHLARAALPEAKVLVLQDLAGLPRLVKIENTPSQEEPEP
jgi:release factor glutamine methyltransferase